MNARLLAREKTRRREHLALGRETESVVIPPGGVFWHVETEVVGHWSYGLCGRRFDAGLVERSAEAEVYTLRRLCCFCRHRLARGE